MIALLPKLAILLFLIGIVAAAIWFALSILPEILVDYRHDPEHSAGVLVVIFMFAVVAPVIACVGLIIAGAILF